MRVVVVSDGKRGHEGQSLALAELLGADKPQVTTIRRPPPVGEPLLRMLSALVAPSRWPSWLRRSTLARTLSEGDIAALISRLGEDAESPMVTIATGTLAAIPALLLAHRFRGKSLQVMRPSLVPLRRFDLVLLPHHDVLGTTGSRVLSFPFALGFTGEDKVARCRQTMRSRLGLKSEQEMPPGKYFTVLIGGESAHFHMDADDILSRMRELTEVAHNRSWRMLLSTSRRTPEEVEEGLKQLQREHRDTIYFAVWARLDSFNPLPAFFDLSEAVLVTEDSVSMASEAILAGHRPLLLPLRPLPKARKVLRFQRYLLERNLARRVESAEDVAAAAEEEIARPRLSREQVAKQLGLYDLVARIRELLEVADAG